MKKISLKLLALFMTLFTAMGCGDFTDEPSNSNEDSNFNLKVYAATAQRFLQAGAGRADKNNLSVADRVFYIGQGRAEIFELLGDPDTIFYGDVYYTPGVDYDKDAYHVYLDIGLSFRIFGPSVKEITLLNSDWTASNGLIVGMSLEQMLEILGDGYEKHEFETKDFYDYPEYDIMVEVYNSDNSIAEININEGNLQQ